VHQGSTPPVRILELIGTGVERRPKTYQGYEGVVRRHLIPELGKKRLGKTEHP
jgi:hypothetical protein